MKMVYVVMGGTGEYEDLREWCVCAYADEGKAEEHVKAARARAKEIGEARPSIYDMPVEVNEHDPLMEMDYTGTDYYYTSVPFKG